MEPYDQDKIENWIDDLCLEPKPLTLEEKFKARAYQTQLSLKAKFARVTAPIWGIVILLGVLSIMAVPAIAQGESCDGYVIKKGDTLWNIAMAHGVEVSWVTSMNNIENPDVIQIGQCLRFPGIGRTYAAQGRYIANNFVGDGPTPGAIALGDALQTVYPQWGRTLDPTYGIGIFNPRPARGGSAPSTHSSGLALDFYVTCDTSKPLFDNLVKHAQALGIERIIVCGDYWRVDNGIMQASEMLAAWHNGELAPAHAHIELTIEAGDNLTYDDAVAILVSDLVVPEPTPEPAPEPIQDPDPVLIDISNIGASMLSQVNP